MRRENQEEEDDDGVNEELDAQQEGMEDQFEAALASRGNTTWAEGGARKDIVIRVLIYCFGSMVESVPRDDAIPDFKGRFRADDMIFQKLLDVSKQVVKAKK
jgi:hypothetical protein